MGKTNWEKLKHLSEEEIQSRAESDPDAQPTTEAMWQNSTVVMPEPGPKEAITIRLSPRVLQYFEREKPGYQKRINAVLEAFVEYEMQAGTSYPTMINQPFGPFGGGPTAGLGWSAIQATIHQHQSTQKSY